MRNTLKHTLIVSGMVVLSLCGIVVGGYLSALKLQEVVQGRGDSAICTALMKQGCARALGTEQSTVLGVPISIFGVAAYLVVLGLLVTRRSDRLGRVSGAALTSISLAAVLYSLWLAAYSAASSSWCPLCISLYGVNAALLALAIILDGRGLSAIPAGLRDIVSGWRCGVVVAGLFVAGVAAGSAVFDAFVDRYAGDRRARDERRVESAVRLGRMPVPDDGSAPSLGPPGAAHVMVELSDFQCPYCRRFWFEAKDLRERHGDDLRLVFRNAPLSSACNPLMSTVFHDRACEAAKAAMCAHYQGRFWEMGTELFSNQEELEDADLREHAAAAGLDLADFEQCMAGEEAAAAVRRDALVAFALGASGTPTVLLDGFLFPGGMGKPSYDDILSRLEEHGRRQAIGPNRAIASAQRMLAAGRVEVAASPRALRKVLEPDLDIIAFVDPASAASKVLLYHLVETQITLEEKVRVSVRILSAPECRESRMSASTTVDPKCGSARLLACGLAAGPAAFVAGRLAHYEGEDFAALAEQTGGADVASCLLRDGARAALVEDGIAFERAAVTQAPTLFLNGFRFDGPLGGNELVQILAVVMLERMGYELPAL